MFIAPSKTSIFDECFAGESPPGVLEKRDEKKNAVRVVLGSEPIWGQLVQKAYPLVVKHATDVEPFQRLVCFQSLLIRFQLNNKGNEFMAASRDAEYDPVEFLIRLNRDLLLSVLESAVTDPAYFFITILHEAIHFQIHHCNTNYHLQHEWMAYESVELMSQAAAKFDSIIGDEHSGDWYEAMSWYGLRTTGPDKQQSAAFARLSDQRRILMEALHTDTMLIAKIRKTLDEIDLIDQKIKQNGDPDQSLQAKRDQLLKDYRRRKGMVRWDQIKQHMKVEV